MANDIWNSKHFFIYPSVHGKKREKFASWIVGFYPYMHSKYNIDFDFL